MGSAREHALSVAVGADAEQAVDFPAVQVRPGHLPVAPRGVRVEEESAFVGAHEHRNLAIAVAVSACHSCRPPL